MLEAASNARQWMRQWRDAEEALAEVRRRELRQLTTEQALRAVEALLSLAGSIPVAEERGATSGLVAQQALLHCLAPR